MKKSQGKHLKKSDPASQISLLSRFFGAIFGAVLRPLENIIIVTLATLVAPFALMLRFYNFCRGDQDWTGILPALFSTLIVSALLAIPTLLIIVAISSVFLMGSVLLSPFVGLVEGLLKGLSQVLFKPSWVSAGAMSLIKNLLPSSRRMSSRERVYKGEPEALGNKLREKLVLVDQLARDHREDLEGLVYKLSPTMYNDVIRMESQLRQSEAQYNRYLRDDLRRSWEESKTLRNLVNRALSLIIPMSAASQASNDFADNLELKLMPCEQTPLNFLTDNELRLLNSKEDLEVHTALINYHNLLESRACVIAGCDLSEISQPLIIEYSKDISRLNEETKQTETVRKTFFMAHELSALTEYVRSCALDQKAPEILAQRPATIEIERMELTADGKYLQTIPEANKADIRIYRGIDQPTYDLLEESIASLRTKLNPNARSVFTDSTSNITHALPVIKINSTKPQTLEELRRERFLNAILARNGMFKPTVLAMNRNPTHGNKASAVAVAKSWTL